MIAKSDYIKSANTVYDNLRNAKDTFKLEAIVISYAKCYLMNNDELNDFYTGQYHVTVYETSSGYDLYVDGYCIELSVYDKQIMAFNIKNIR